MENDVGSWSILTVSFLFVLYIALCGVVLSSVLHLANAKWRFQIRKLACSFSALFPIAGVMLLILLANGEMTFPWLAQVHADGHGGGHDLHLNGWHNYAFLVTRQIVGFLVVIGLCGAFLRYQYLSEVDSSYKVQRRFRNIALLIPFLYFGYASMMAWDFEMTQVPGWHSSLYAPYHFQSMFHMFLAFFTIFMFFIYRSGRLVKPFEPKLFNYMAQFMLAMTIMWTYFYFAQYLIMWYGRLPWEMERFHSMMWEGYGPLWWTFLVFKFIIPFCTLALTPNRHNPVTITTVACFIVVGTFIERYTWISGSVDSQYYQMPFTSMFDFIVVLLTIGVGWWAVNRTMVKYGLIQAPSKQAAASDRTG